MDVSVRTSMKSAVNCDKCCDLQNSGNQQNLERMLRFWDIPESKPASVSQTAAAVAVAMSAALQCCALCAKTIIMLLAHQMLWCLAVGLQLNGSST